ncbi:hypothetical protein [Hymenobacter weizhouensis]|uniref:hypothetical protein n=1 Tax=Hymenobacter sp. YIM 151500-1 TaxID=2987689 RepID=UPI0022278392|nr:hypothetical protein [Hymenobacter sp. YIM 151500-1]UYZ63824.1 hypothetical protein OIS53_03035 [Hymenobacter sp. YIM 151500-1]
MQEFLRKLRLITDVSIPLKTDKTQFVQLLQQHVDAGKTDFFSSLFSSAFEVFSSSPNQYVGEIWQDSFKIRRKAHLFEPSLTFARVKGQVASTAEGTLVEAEIDGSSGVLSFVAFLAVFYLIFIVTTLFSGQLPVVALVFFLFHGALMIGIPYLVTRRGVQRMAYNLERDLYFIVKE